MKIFKCCGDESVRLSESAFVCGSKDVAENKDGRKMGEKLSSGSASTSEKKGRFRFRKWIGKHLRFWRKQKGTVSHEIQSETITDVTTPTESSNPNEPSWVSALSCAEESAAEIKIDVPTSKESSAEGTESRGDWSSEAGTVSHEIKNKTITDATEPNTGFDAKGPSLAEESGTGLKTEDVPAFEDITTYGKELDWTTYAPEPNTGFDANAPYLVSCAQESETSITTDWTSHWTSADDSSEGGILTSTSSSESEQSSSSESLEMFTTLAEKNLEMFIKMKLTEESMRQNTRLKTSYLLLAEPSGEGEFSMGRKIGQGAFASVRKGQWSTRNSDGEVTTKDVAIKIIKPKDEKHFKTSANELKALTRLNHPNIVELHFIHISARKIHLGIEFASRGDLNNYLEEEGPLAEYKARIWFNQIVDAVQHCHMNGIAHSDIKSQNILIDHDMTAKLTDFGLSLVQPDPGNITEQGFQKVVYCGTRPYMAPEIFSHYMHDSRKCDVWSLGVLLYLMLTIEYPFSDGSIERMYKEIWEEGIFGANYLQLAYDLYHPPTFPPGLSGPVTHLINTMLTIDAKHRPTIGQVQCHQWTKETAVI